MSFDPHNKIQKLTEEGYSFNFGEYLSDAHRLVEKNMAYFVVTTLILLVVPSLIRLPFSFSEEASLQIIGGGLGIIINIITTLIFISFYYAARESEKDQNFSFGKMFIAFQEKPGLFIGVIFLTGLLQVLGFILFIIPGIYLAVAYSLALPFVAFTSLGIWEAMKASRKLITKNWWSFFGMMIVLFFINLAGLLLCGLGLLYTIPFTYCTFYAIYSDLIGFEEEADDDLSRHLYETNDNV